MIYDVVVCVSSAHKMIALKTIRSIALFSQARKIFILAYPKDLMFFQNNLTLNSQVFLLDKDQIIEENIDFHFIKNILEKRIGSHQRAGWYFQQFLKMAACNLPDIAHHYLIWDADTLMLGPLDFFDGDEKILINSKSDNHKPYFDCIMKIIGLKKCVDFSFISSHLMVKKSYMRELIEIIKRNAPGNISWVEFILDSINDKHLPGSGFSEYETYGNYITANHKHSYICRSIKSTRNGTKYYGRNPSKYDIFSLMKSGYLYATFEIWQLDKKSRLAINKFRSITIYYALNLLTNRYIGMRKAATALCADKKRRNEVQCANAPYSVTEAQLGETREF